MSSTDANLSDAARPVPPPFVWTRRILIGVAVLLVVALIVRLAWGFVADRRLAALEAEARQRGEPWALADFEPLPLAAEHNGALVLQKAADAVSANTFLTALPDADLSKLVQDNAAALVLLREARRYEQANWRSTLGAQFTSQTRRSYVAQQLLTFVAANAARYSHMNGDHAEAVERLHDIHHQADLIAFDAAPYANELAGATTWIAAVTALEIAPTLTIQVSQTDATASAATRQQVTALIAELLDNSAERAVRQQAALSERALNLDWFQQRGQENWLLRPMFMLDAARSMRGYEQYRLALEATNYPDAQAIVDANLPTEPPFTPIWLHTGYRVEIPSSDLAPGFGLRVDRIAAAVALAVRLYQVDHDAYPPTLDALVPAYLPAVPSDPFAADDRPIGYVLLADGHRPVLYSIGRDGVDDTAGGTPVPDGHQLYFDPLCVDQWRDLSRWAADVNDSEQALVDQSAPPDQPRHNAEADAGQPDP